MNNPSASSASPSTPSTGSCSSSGPTNLILLDVQVLEDCIGEVLSSLTDEGARNKLRESVMELKVRDMVQSVASDFSELFKSISEGTEIISDQKSSSSKLSSEAPSAALEAVKDLGNIHWAGIGLLAIANVLERFDKISANDRDCLDLLKLMLDLAKFLKQLKDTNADYHKEISEKMNEALHLIVSGAISCRSFIRRNKMLKFFFTTKTRDELLYIRKKVDTIMVQLGLHMQFKAAFQQPYSDAAGEMERAAQTEISATDSDVVSRVNEWKDVLCKASNWVDRPQKSNRLLPTFLRAPTYLKKLRERRSSSQRKQKPGKKIVLGISLDKSQLSSFSIEHDSGGLTIHFTLKELEIATNGFIHELRPDDGWSNLYKGTLSSGRLVQVKSFLDREVMLKELLCMENFRHKNIAKLVGFCTTKEKAMLVYDYQPNGHLSDSVFGSSRQTEFLDWPKRLKIILGVINALVYLHEGADEHMHCMHRDIKPHNILLDDNFNAKVSGFEIAEFLAFDDCEFSGPINGTRGYIAPECFYSSHLSYKADIFSFGILVLEVVAGRRMFDLTREEDDIYLLDQAWTLYIEDRLDELICPELLDGEGCELSSIIRSIKIALWCVVPDPSLRPTTSRVSAMLSTEEEIPPLPNDSMLMEPHSLHQGTPSSVQSDESHHMSAFEMGSGEIEELPRA